MAGLFCCILNEIIEFQSILDFANASINNYIMDPVNDGSKIFLKLFKEIGVKKITDLNVLDQFLNRLITEMQGWVILDFMDGGNWDCIGSYSIDFDKRYLFLYWHYYIESPKLENFISTQSIKPYVSSATIHFKELNMESIEHFPFIAIKGYSIKEKEALKYLKSISTDVKILDGRKKNFCTIYKRDKENYLEDCYCFNTPIYSSLIIPKNTASSTLISSKMLFLYNYNNCMNRISEISSSLKRKSFDDDELSGKANTIRTIFESALKIECCYHKEINFTLELDDDQFVFPKEYSELLLGGLLKILEPIKNDIEKDVLKSIIRLSNELSHDSGKPVTLDNVLFLIDTTKRYINGLISMIKF